MWGQCRRQKVKQILALHWKLNKFLIKRREYSSKESVRQFCFSNCEFSQKISLNKFALSSCSDSNHFQLHQYLILNKSSSPTSVGTVNLIFKTSFIEKLQNIRIGSYSLISSGKKIERIKDNASYFSFIIWPLLIFSFFLRFVFTRLLSELFSEFFSTSFPQKKKKKNIVLNTCILTQILSFPFLQYKHQLTTVLKPYLVRASPV